MSRASRKQSPRAASWVYDVINAFIEALEAETSFLRVGDATWRFYNSQLELLRPLKAYLSREAQHIHRDLLNARPEVGKRLAPHDAMRAQLEAAASSAAQDVLTGSDLRAKVDDARQRYAASHPADIPTGAFPQEKLADLVAEHLVNNAVDLSPRHTDAVFWREHRHEFLGYAKRPSFDLLAAHREALLAFNESVIEWLANYSFALCDEFDIPAAFSGAATVASSDEPYSDAVSVWIDTLRARVEHWQRTQPGKGWFTVMVFPDLVIHDDMDHVGLKKLVRAARVELKGLQLPTLDAHQFSRVENLDGAIRGYLDLQEYQEVWQLHDSGVFMWAKLLQYKNETGEALLPFEEIVWLVALGVSFAQRLLTEIMPEGRVSLEFALNGVQGHELGSFDEFVRTHHRLTVGHLKSAQDTLVVPVSTAVSTLRSDWRKLVEDVSSKLLNLFNWDHPHTAVEQHVRALRPESPG